MKFRQTYYFQIQLFICFTDITIIIFYLYRYVTILLILTIPLLFYGKGGKKHFLLFKNHFLLFINFFLGNFGSGETTSSWWCCWPEQQPDRQPPRSQVSWSSWLVVLWWCSSCRGDLSNISTSGHGPTPPGPSLCPHLPAVQPRSYCQLPFGHPRSLGLAFTSGTV